MALSLQLVGVACREFDRRRQREEPVLVLALRIRCAVDRNLGGELHYPACFSSRCLEGSETKIIAPAGRTYDFVFDLSQIAVVCAGLHRSFVYCGFTWRGRTFFFRQLRVSSQTGPLDWARGCRHCNRTEVD